MFCLQCDESAPNGAPPALNNPTAPDGDFGRPNEGDAVMEWFAEEVTYWHGADRFIRLCDKSTGVASKPLPKAGDPGGVQRSAGPHGAATDWSLPQPRSSLVDVGGRAPIRRPAPSRCPRFGRTAVALRKTESHSGSRRSRDTSARSPRRTVSRERTADGHSLRPRDCPCSGGTCCDGRGTRGPCLYYFPFSL
jgi:hypothetical protein